VARKLAVLCWHLLTNDADYQWARPAGRERFHRATILARARPWSPPGRASNPSLLWELAECKRRHFGAIRRTIRQD